MSLMWVWLILVMVFMLGSMFWLLPSVGQRRRMQLRQAAMREKMKVRMVGKNLAELIDIESDIEGDIVLYQYYVPFESDESWFADLDKLKNSQIHWCLKTSQGQWPEAWPLPDLETPFQMDKPIKVLISREGAGWVWDETGSLEDLARLIRMISVLLVAIGKVGSLSAGQSVSS